MIGVEIFDLSPHEAPSMPNFNTLIRKDSTAQRKTPNIERIDVPIPLLNSDRIAGPDSFSCLRVRANALKPNRAYY